MEKSIEFFLEEYRQLKGEQISRIGFRDNLIYVTLTAFGAIISFTVTTESGYISLLVIPWICLILGWTYLNNDEKITTIGRYIKDELKLKLLNEKSIDNQIFGWENYHSTNKGRKRRKINQLFIDLITFVVPGVISIVAFDYLSTIDDFYISTLIIVEIIFLIYLFIEILIHSNF
jgi:hypothetical protein